MASESNYSLLQKATAEQLLTHTRTVRVCIVVHHASHITFHSGESENYLNKLKIDTLNHILLHFLGSYPKSHWASLSLNFKRIQTKMIF